MRPLSPAPAVVSRAASTVRVSPEPMLKRVPPAWVSAALPPVIRDDRPLPRVETPWSKFQLPYCVLGVVAPRTPPFMTRTLRWQVELPAFVIVPPELIVMLLLLEVTMPTNELSPPTRIVPPELTVTSPLPTGPGLAFPPAVWRTPPLTVVPPV